ncbi:MAG: hypothetical protein A2513_09485 [Sulfurimonas sp. RIFOXYD12_FULL_33_39]|uniref:hypothetical protein n=1 Tax=unclassified Sulfurimonas TaxID=2623549 RepID=UPI0008ABDFD1|nr:MULTISPECIES: hypothetical protein [unclassified Sulfurimonas]OHE06755.1 MAG: hypothetical protein A3G74_06635 [Sulfurimonas sp. RIFCSPLOWO2_12_FULL_34_6]OHE10683.1 MAG: hypothetical protein A2513_09485 [Sulfurimonas sp. RIFOXYD12_FULL_33_39]OHE13196.1 MAG: hypothetical protein A2530_11075 [Sulfurimonas sp. RIFOXYD2_FULL_34_21]DAB27461.1 MAG TPA: hypothetical protein CFH78_07570 [Sulfurimonas sp. UBA10385]
MKFFNMLIMTAAVLFASDNGYSTKSNWLMDIDSANGRFEAVQKQFRGFDTAMMEVGYRYESVKKAVDEKNYELALYHWQKIKTAMQNGYVRRPAREEASRIYFLDNTYEEFKKMLVSQNDTKIEERFSYVKDSCNACHINQKVGFITVK